METKPATIGTRFIHNGTEYEVKGILADALLVKHIGNGKIFNLSFVNEIYKTHFIPEAPQKQVAQEGSIDWGNRSNIYIDTLLKVADEVTEYTAPAVLAKIFSARNTRAFITIFAVAYLYKKECRFTQKQVQNASDSNPGNVESFKQINDEQLAQILQYLNKALLNNDKEALNKILSLTPTNSNERALMELFVTKNGIKDNKLQFYYINNNTLKAFIKEFTNAEVEI